MEDAEDAVLEFERNYFSKRLAKISKQENYGNNNISQNVFFSSPQHPRSNKNHSSSPLPESSDTSYSTLKLQKNCNIETPSIIEQIGSITEKKLKLKGSIMENIPTNENFPHKKLKRHKIVGNILKPITNRSKSHQEIICNRSNQQSHVITERFKSNPALNPKSIHNMNNSSPFNLSDFPSPLSSIGSSDNLKPDIILNKSNDLNGDSYDKSIKDLMSKFSNKSKNESPDSLRKFGYFLRKSPESSRLLMNSDFLSDSEIEINRSKFKPLSDYRFPGTLIGSRSRSLFTKSPLKFHPNKINVLLNNNNPSFKNTFHYSSFLHNKNHSTSCDRIKTKSDKESMQVDSVSGRSVGHNKTGLFYDMNCAFHFGNIDEPESPERYEACVNMLISSGVSERCLPLLSTKATDEEILLVHSEDLLEELLTIVDRVDEQECGF